MQETNSYAEGLLNSWENEVNTKKQNNNYVFQLFCDCTSRDAEIQTAYVQLWEVSHGN